jgi:NADH dehydrogenase
LATLARRVTVFGGTGFLGRRIASALVARGFAVQVASRHPPQDPSDLVQGVEADINDDRSVAAAVQGSFGVVNAVSLYVERDGQSFHSVHVEAAERLARHASKAAVERLAHVSGIGSDPTSTSPYIACRGRGEEVVRQAFPNASVIRPAAMYGPDDALVVPISRLLRRLPVFALFGSGETRLQPPHVENVAEAVAQTFDVATPAPVYELGGPRIYTYLEFLKVLRRHLEARTLFVPLPFGVWHGLATFAERLPQPPITRNQVELMRRDNVVSGKVSGFASLQIAPRTLEESLPQILPKKTA